MRLYLGTYWEGVGSAANTSAGLAVRKSSDLQSSDGFFTVGGPKDRWIVTTRSSSNYS